MAEKEQKYPYGTSYLPEGEKKYSVIRWGWNGLNKTDDIDTGQLTDMSGMICDPPYMVPVKQAKTWIDLGDGIPCDGANIATADRSTLGVPISIAGYDKYLYLVWEDYDPELQKYTAYINDFINRGNGTVCGYRTMEKEYSDSTANVPRTIVQFNVVNMVQEGNIASYTYSNKNLIYPDCYSVPYQWSGTSQASLFNIDDPDDPNYNPIPASNYAAVYGSRVFGANKNAVFSSAFNSYVDYTLDDANGTSPDHAWWSMAQSNTEASGDVTAICTYDNHVVIFRKDFMQLVYNNKNPFRIVDVGEFGCDNNKAWTILNGVLYFASQDKVYAFTGGTPKEISKKLEIDDLSGAVLGSYKNTVWMQTKDELYIYRDGTWSQLGYSWKDGTYAKIIQFATLDYGLVALVDHTPPTSHLNHHYSLMYLDWDVDALGFEPSDPDWWEPEYATGWWFETDLMMLGKLDVRRVKKVSLLCEGEPNSGAAVYLLPDNGVYDITDDDEYRVGSVTFDQNEKKMLRVLTRQFSGTRHKLRIAGHGYVKIYAAELKISWGGELYVEG